MQDLQTDKPKPIYEYDINIFLNKIFDRNNNGIYKTEFLEQLENEIEAKKKHLEKWIENHKVDELLERKKRFTALAEPCNKLYYNKFIIENTGSIKDIWLTKDWKKSDYFNALVCIRFLQYQEQQIKHFASDDIENEKELTVNQKIHLLKLIGFFDKGSWFYRRIIEDRKQKIKVAKIISALIGRNERDTREAIDHIVDYKNQGLPHIGITGKFNKVERELIKMFSLDDKERIRND